MDELFSKMDNQTLKEQFIKKIQQLIISGELKEGQQLPPERELAAKLGISRGIVNSGIVELSAAGLLRTIPRKGTFVSKFADQGSIQALELLMTYSDGVINRKLFLEMIEVKRELESRCAFLAAVNHTPQQLTELKKTLDLFEKEKDPEELIALNFEFHHRIALATGNSIYALLDKSFRAVSLNIIRYFYSEDAVLKKSRELMLMVYNYMERRDADKAAAAIREIFDFAESFLKKD